MKKLFVNGQLVALNNWKIEERDEPEKFTIKIFFDDSFERSEWEDIKFFSNNRKFSFDDNIENLEEKEGYKYFKVYMLDHSGYRLSKTPFSDAWDSGLLGVAEVDNTRGDADRIFDAFFEELKASMEGEVYGFQVKDELGEVVESVWGFYGENIEEEILDSLSAEYGLNIEDVKKAFDNVQY